MKAIEHSYEKLEANRARIDRPNKMDNVEKGTKKKKPGKMSNPERPARFDKPSHTKPLTHDKKGKRSEGVHQCQPTCSIILPWRVGLVVGSLFCYK